MRLPLQDVYKFSCIGTVPVGRDATGVLKPVTMIRFAPCGVESECVSVETHHEALSEAKPGANVVFNVRKVTVKDILRWHVASDAKDKPTTGDENFTTQVIMATQAAPEGLHAGP